MLPLQAARSQHQDLSGEEGALFHEAGPESSIRCPAIIIQGCRIFSSGGLAQASGAGPSGGGDPCGSGGGVPPSEPAAPVVPVEPVEQTRTVSPGLRGLVRRQLRASHGHLQAQDQDELLRIALDEVEKQVRGVTHCHLWAHRILRRLVGDHRMCAADRVSDETLATIRHVSLPVLLRETFKYVMGRDRPQDPVPEHADDVYRRRAQLWAIFRRVHQQMLGDRRIPRVPHFPVPKIAEYDIQEWSTTIAMHLRRSLKQRAVQAGRLFAAVAAEAGGEASKDLSRWGGYIGASIRSLMSGAQDNEQAAWRVTAATPGMGGFLYRFINAAEEDHGSEGERAQFLAALAHHNATRPKPSTQEVLQTIVEPQRYEQVILPMLRRVAALVRDARLPPGVAMPHSENFGLLHFETPGWAEYIRPLQVLRQVAADQDHDDPNHKSPMGTFTILPQVTYSPRFIRIDDHGASSILQATNRRLPPGSSSKYLHVPPTDRRTGVPRGALNTLIQLEGRHNELTLGHGGELRSIHTNGLETRLCITTREVPENPGAGPAPARVDVLGTSLANLVAASRNNGWPRGLLNDRRLHQQYLDNPDTFPRYRSIVGVDPGVILPIAAAIIPDPMEQIRRPAVDVIAEAQARPKYVLTEAEVHKMLLTTRYEKSITCHRRSTGVNAYFHPHNNTDVTLWTHWTAVARYMFEKKRLRIWNWRRRSAKHRAAHQIAQELLLYGVRQQPVRRVKRDKSRRQARELREAQDPERPVLIAFGSASIGGGYRGHRPIPHKLIIKKLLEYNVPVVLRDEWCTSACCSYCGNKDKRHWTNQGNRAPQAPMMADDDEHENVTAGALTVDETIIQAARQRDRPPRNVIAAAQDRTERKRRWALYRSNRPPPPRPQPRYLRCVIPKCRRIAERDTERASVSMAHNCARTIVFGSERPPWIPPNWRL